MRVLRRVIAVRPAAEVAALRLLRIHVLDEAPSRGGELGAQRARVEAGDEALAHRCDSIHRPPGCRRASRLECGGIDIGEEEEASRRRDAADRAQRLPDGGQGQIDDHALPGEDARCIGVEGRVAQRVGDRRRFEIRGDEVQVRRGGDAGA